MFSTSIVFGKRLPLPYCIRAYNFRFWGLSAIIYSYIIQFSVLLLFSPLPLIAKDSCSLFAGACFVVQNCSPTPRSCQIGSVSCCWQFLSDKKENMSMENWDENYDIDCNKLIPFWKWGSYFSAYGSHNKVIWLSQIIIFYLQKVRITVTILLSHGITCKPYLLTMV